MQIGILGGTSLIARDLIVSLGKSRDVYLSIFSRQVDAVSRWLIDRTLTEQCNSKSYEQFSDDQHYDAVINFVGVGSPARAIEMGGAILETTLYYDGLVLNYLAKHPNCRYLFLSSGAVYGAGFQSPSGDTSVSTWNVNNLRSQDWYGISKLHAECRHRSLPNLAIVDIRVFNYFSHSQSLSDGFFITDALRAIKNNEIFLTSGENFFRDYLGPADFASLIRSVLSSDPKNDVIDCYTLAPVSKCELLEALASQYELRFKLIEDKVGLNATGDKSNYYSLNKRAESFGYLPKFNALQTVLKEIEIMRGLRSWQY